MTEVAVDPLYAHLLEVALDAARRAVELIHDNRPDHLQVDTKSSATDHVTEMDRASERLIRSTILSARPGDVIVGEENETIPTPTGGDAGSDSKGTEGSISNMSGGSSADLAIGPLSDTVATWYVDPIDGTTNYVYDHPGYNVSIAAEVNGQVVAGVVADPTHGRTYSATLGGGAFCDGRRLLLPESGPGVAQALVATGFGYSAERRGRQGRVVAELLPQIRDIRRMGAAALDLCSVASGLVDAYYEVGLSIWDLAAGQLVATEAGARVGPIDGGPGLPGSVLACRKDLFEPLQELLAALRAGEV